MDAVGLALSSAQTLFAALQCSELKELFSKLGYESDLESLKGSVDAIKAVLLDADAKQFNGLELSATERSLIDRIKDVVYDADDLLDEYVTRAKLQHIRMESGNKLSRKVRSLLSSFEKLKDAYSRSPEVKKTAKKLVEIARDAQSFKVDCPPIRREREVTYSYVKEDKIIGREDDHRRIVDMLLHPADLPVLAIVGVGGLGKTALAQLVYNDPMIQNKFSLHMWVCVSDQGGKQFNEKAILTDIYKSATRGKSVGDLGLVDLLVQELRRVLAEHKYLLVLDDLWSENSDECGRLVDILIGEVQRGSKIVVTTRSRKTASAIGSSRPYELRGLSDEDSWRLFEREVGKKIEQGHDLFEICKDIVTQCFNVPLAIRVVGSLLWALPEHRWQSFQQSRLFVTNNDDNRIMQILKFSYYHLSTSLKSCFTYCAIFPKDSEIPKEKLISMWMAHDYVKDEVEAEDNFQTLVERCFFQDIRRDYKWEITFKIHDLMHDMAQGVVGKEIYIANAATTKLDEKIRHLYDGAPANRTKGFVTRAKIRSYVHHRYFFKETGSNIQFHVSTILAKWRHLRVLDLRQLGIRQLPDAIGELLHLRHLDLYQNWGLKVLPEALTKLINLQMLNVEECSDLKELPRDFNKLVNLRTLYLPNELEYMPLGMAKMTRLTRLNVFILGQRKSCLKQEVTLEDLRATRNVKGSLVIWVSENYKHAKEYSGEGGYICNTEHLNAIHIRWDHQANGDKRVGNDEDLLEDLQPHSNLKVLYIWSYPGVRMPRWARKDNLTTSLPNLVVIQLHDCNGLQELPWLGRLQHLKTLELEYLKNVEYMENRTSIGSSSDDGAVASNTSTAVESSIFFPSLETLKLKNMPKLKGWWRGTSNSTSEIVNSDRSMVTAPFPSFPCLSKLTIESCPNLSSIPLCPAVEILELYDLDERFRILMEEDEKGVESSISSSSSSNNDSGNWRSHHPKMRKINTDNVGYLKSLPKEAFQCLTEMEIKWDDKVESLSEMEEVFRGCSSSLRSLTWGACKNLISVSPGGLEYLTALEQLELSSLPELRLDENEEEEEEGTGTGTGIGTGMPWKCLGKCLRFLRLRGLKKVVNLPKGMRYLTALQSLEIYNLPLKDLPEWIECLSSLHSLQIMGCKHLESLPRALRNLTSLQKFCIFGCGDKLKHRCEKPDGEYCPILERIPNFHIKRGPLF